MTTTIKPGSTRHRSAPTCAAVRSTPRTARARPQLFDARSGQTAAVQLFFLARCRCLSGLFAGLFDGSVGRSVTLDLCVRRFPRTDAHLSTSVNASPPYARPPTAVTWR